MFQTKHPVPVPAFEAALQLAEVLQLEQPDLHGEQTETTRHHRPYNRLCQNYPKIQLLLRMS